MIRESKRTLPTIFDATVLRAFDVNGETWFYVDAPIGIHWIVRRVDGAHERWDVGVRRIDGRVTERFESTSSYRGSNHFALVVGGEDEQGGGWLVADVCNTGEAYYQHDVCGLNLYSGEEFHWRVPSVAKWDRYDLRLVGVPS